ncbi:PIN domain-containing protein [Halosimplex salinum]|uniref:PIN domain-containing protein n=1 Tax=Halosimplex salinum TaxID=1710538 RepID=UPI000F465430|nr:PIN domain-containing protein [Halosimplex salinum]
MYVETDFLVALVKEDDWLREPVLTALEERDDVHTSILSYAELLVLFYDRAAEAYEIDVPRATTDLIELVPVVPREHEDAILAAAAFIDEHELTPFDALHAGLVTTADERVMSSELDYETVGLERVPLGDEQKSED